MFEIDQFRSRVEPEIFGQQVPGALGRVKCVDLATGALQGQHEFCPERFAPRFGTEFGFEPFDNFIATAGGERLVGPLVDSAKPECGKPLALSDQGWCATKTIERSALPPGERSIKVFGRVFEPGGVNVVASSVEHVAHRRGLDGPRVEEAAKFEHETAQCSEGRWWW